MNKVFISKLLIMVVLMMGFVGVGVNNVIGADDFVGPPEPPQKTIIENPIAADNLQCFALQVFKLIVNVLSFVAVGYIIWAGFLFIKAQGSDSELVKAKHAIVNALIGSALIFGAWVFAEIITRTINDVAGNSGANSALNSQCGKK